MDPRRTHPAFEPSYRPPPPSERGMSETPSVMARAARTPLARLLVMIAAACTGLAGVVTATGAAVANVIASVAEANARRTNGEIDRRIEAVETRVNGRFGLDLEEKARREKDDELLREIESVRAECRATRRRAP